MTAGAVYDRGYRPYDGKRGGRRAAVLALYRASLRRALGIRRSWKQKLMPGLLLAVVTMPALVQVGIGYATRDTPASGFSIITYREYVGVSSALLLFVALTAPDLVAPDRRQKVLPLILARQLTGRDYALVKVAAVTSLVFAFSLLPQVFLFVGQLLVSDDSWQYTQDNAAVLWKVPLSVLVLALFYGVSGIALACLSGRRIVGAAGLLGATLVTSAVSGILVEVQRNNGADGSVAGLLNLITLPLQVRDLVFLGELDADSSLYGVSGGGTLAVLAYAAVVAAGLATVLTRYRTAER